MAPNATRSAQSGLEERPAVSAERLAREAPARRLELLGSSSAGLSEAEAATRLGGFGPNEPAAAQTHHPIRAVLSQFTHTLALLLWLAAGLAFAAGVPELGGAILAVILVNGLFAALQERRAEQVVAALMARVAVHARCRRDDIERRIPARELVPGDIVRLGPGDLVPADCVLIESDNLTLDLSMLTGETVPVERDAAAAPDDVDGRRTLGLEPLLPAGTAVVTGTGVAAVHATGMATAVGGIATLVEGVKRGPSALEREVAELSRVTAAIAVVAGAAALILIAALTDTTVLVALTFATGVIVALVPEGLLPTLSVALAAGADRMAHRGAAVRRLSAVEIIGSATTICTDKTGTLTENSVHIRGFVAPDGGERPERLALLAAALCNDALVRDGEVTGDPIDSALAEWVADHGERVEALRQAHPRLRAIPFDAHRRSMSVTCMLDGQAHTFVKGAPEALMGGIGAAPSTAVIESAIEEATGLGERILMIAGGPEGGVRDVIGVVRFHDPPRPEVPTAIEACRRAGIRVVMLTGDHPTTARAVAASIGLRVDERDVFHGDDLDRLTDLALSDLVRHRRNAIVARADPRQKLRIVTLLRQAGEIVAVTGDGVNDAPALRAADVGIAMGHRGTEVAKQAADIVVADDNFATIVAAIESGRAIKTNIRRFVSYVVTSNVAELAPFVLYTLLPIALPLAVIQVLAIDLGTDVVPALALGLERPSRETMDLRPEAPGTPLMGRRLALRTFLFFGVIEAALGLGAWCGRYLAEGWRPFDAMAPFQTIDREAATLTFLGIVAGQVGCLFAQRDGSLLRRLAPSGNRWIYPSIAFEVGLTVALIYVPWLNRLFQMSPVSPVWLLVLPGGAAIFVLLDLARRWAGRTRTRPIPG